ADEHVSPKRILATKEDRDPQDGLRPAEDQQQHQPGRKRLDISEREGANELEGRLRRVDTSQQIQQQQADEMRDQDDPLGHEAEHWEGPQTVTWRGLIELDVHRVRLLAERSIWRGSRRWWRGGQPPDRSD